MRDEKERLKDIIEAIELIYKNIHKRKLYELNDLELAGVIHYLQILGEACRTLSIEFRQKYSEVGWNKIIGMRNILVHQYFDINTDVINSVVNNHLSELKYKIETILKELN